MQPLSPLQALDLLIKNNPGEPILQIPPILWLSISDHLEKGRRHGILIVTDYYPNKFIDPKKVSIN